MENHELGTHNDKVCADNSTIALVRGDQGDSSLSKKLEERYKKKQVIRMQLVT